MPLAYFMDFSSPIMLVAGLWLVRQGWRGERVGIDPRCRKCGYNLRNLESKTCPECATDLSTEKNTVFGVRRRSYFSIVLGLLTVGPAGYGCYWVMASVWQRMAPHHPTAVLLAKIEAVGFDWAAMSELQDRFRDGTPTASQAERFFRLLTNNPTYLSSVESFDRIALRYREPFAVFLDEAITASTKDPAVRVELIGKLAYRIPREIFVSYPEILQRINDLAVDEAQKRLEQRPTAQPSNQASWVDVVKSIVQDDGVALHLKKQILEGTPANPALVTRPVIEQGAPLPFHPQHMPNALSNWIRYLWMPNRITVDGRAIEYVWPDRFLLPELQDLDEYLMTGELARPIDSLIQQPQEIPHVLTHDIDPGTHQLRVQGSISSFFYNYEDRSYTQLMEQPIDLRASFEVRARTELASTSVPPGTAPAMTTCGMQNYPYPGGHVLQGSCVQIETTDQGLAHSLFAQSDGQEFLLGYCLAPPKSKLSGDFIIPSKGRLTGPVTFIIRPEDELRKYTLSDYPVFDGEAVIGEFPMETPDAKKLMHQLPVDGKR